MTATLTPRRTVYPTSDIAPLWADGIGDRTIRNPQGNFYADGDTVYSYGSHFPIAKRCVTSSGHVAYLITTRRYSSTTDKHIVYVRRAIGDATHFDIPLYDDDRGGKGADLWDDIDPNKGTLVRDWFTRRIEDALRDAQTPRTHKPTRERRLTRAIALRDEWRLLRKMFGLRTDLTCTPIRRTVNAICERYDIGLITAN